MTSRDLRKIRLPQVLADLQPLGEDGVARRDSPISPVPPELLQTVPVVAHPGRGGHSDEHYRHVATLYATALVAAPHSPMQWLATQLHASPATAYRWRDEAIKRGLLPARETERRGATRDRQRPKRKGSR